jgi:tetratricopeptide (TPR) repeat protein
MRSVLVVCVLIAGVKARIFSQSSSATAAAKTAQSAHAATSSSQQNPAQLFQAGQDALQQGRLNEAENDFRRLISIDPQLGGAYANLGVVYMRRKQWQKALQMLNKAEQLMPDVAGIRLNIGLAYYRQNEFLKAIPPFESVVHEQPTAAQPRHLLGLCYFFAERWSDAAHMLEPLWDQKSRTLSYLYVVNRRAPGWVERPR